MIAPTVMRLKEKYLISKRIKRKGAASSGSTQTPRHKRRTPHHNKGVAYPGMWVVKGGK